MNRDDHPKIATEEPYHHPAYTLENQYTCSNMTAIKGYLIPTAIAGAGLAVVMSTMSNRKIKPARSSEEHGSARGRGGMYETKGKEGGDITTGGDKSAELSGN
jgi:hypothetical protein